MLVQLNDRVVGFTELDRTQRRFGLLHAVLRVMNYYITIIIIIIIIIPC